MTAWAVVGCEGPAETDTTNVFRARKFLTATQPTKGLGEPCETYAEKECLSGICLHWKGTDPNSGFVCSKRCADSSECTGQGHWECVQVYPGPNASFCVPGDDNQIRHASTSSP